jgi:hypothetical protein
VYRPVSFAGQTLVDGGVHSSTNLDLVADGRHALVVAIAPMCCDLSLPTTALLRMGRHSTVRQVKHESAMVRATGSDVLLIYPGPADLKLHGRNLMRPNVLAAAGRVIAQSAYEHTARALSDRQVESLLAAVDLGAVDEAA